MQIIDQIFEFDLNKESLFWSGKEYGQREGVQVMVFEGELDVAIIYTGTGSESEPEVLKCFCEKNPSWAENCAAALEEYFQDDQNTHNPSGDSLLQNMLDSMRLLRGYGGHEELLARMDQAIEKRKKELREQNIKPVK